MTQADNAIVALRRSLDSKPSPGPGPVTIKTPLPDGWASFCSRADEDNAPRWYATSPYNVAKLQEQYGEAAAELVPTVCAVTWHGLHRAVAEQVQLHRRLTRATR